MRLKKYLKHLVYKIIDPYESFKLKINTVIEYRICVLRFLHHIGRITSMQYDKQQKNAST